LNTGKGFQRRSLGDDLWKRRLLEQSECLGKIRHRKDAEREDQHAHAQLDPVKDLSDRLDRYDQKSAANAEPHRQETERLQTERERGRRL
jgi:hypothetical protein